MTQPDLQRDLNRELEVATRIALEAGQVLTKARATGLEVRFKGVDDPVTQADIAADTLIRASLLEVFPDDGLLSEETADHPSRLQKNRVWIVDPIDGTSSYAAGRDNFAVSIGLAVNGEAVLGVVYNPAKDELIAGALGLGATLNGSSVTTTSTSSVEAATLLVSSSEWRAGLNVLQPALPITPISSIAYKLGLVASGKADGTFTANARYEWDVCAGAALVAAAGGIASLRDGSPLRFNQPSPRLPWGILAAGKNLHSPLLEALRELPTAAWAETRKR
jgi:myo-inositol-1(or 4)-monophosphatase